MSAPITQLEVIAGCLNGDDNILSDLLPNADAELRGLFAGTGPAMGLTEDAIHASAMRVYHKTQPDAPVHDEFTLTASAFALGFVVAARLFGGMR